MNTCAIVITTAMSSSGSEETEYCIKMIENMYINFAIKKDWKIEHHDKDNHTLVLNGENIYDILKNETGIHRICRISQFDPKLRRHVTYVNVSVYPDKTKEEINKKWIRIRGYIFDPYTLVQCYRTDFKTEDVNSILEGNLDEFINTYD